jgi:hypothetical protein
MTPNKHEGSSLRRAKQHSVGLRSHDIHAVAVVGGIVANAVLVLVLAAGPRSALGQSTPMPNTLCVDDSGCASVVATYGCGSRAVSLMCPASCGGCGDTATVSSGGPSTTAAPTAAQATTTVSPLNGQALESTTTIIPVTRAAKGGLTTGAMPTGAPTSAPTSTMSSCVDAPRCSSLLDTSNCATSSTVAAACPIFCGLCAAPSQSPSTAAPTTAAPTTATPTAPDTTVSTTTAVQTTTPASCIDGTRCPSLVSFLGCNTTAVASSCPVSCGTCTRPTLPPPTTTTATPNPYRVSGVRVTGGNESVLATGNGTLHPSLYPNVSVVGRVEVQVSGEWGAYTLPC